VQRINSKIALGPPFQRGELNLSLSQREIERDFNGKSFGKRDFAL
jgi:hypothetical protein